MKVKELRIDTNLAFIKVQLPEDVLIKFQKFCGGEPQMWIVGDMMGEFFLSPDQPVSNPPSPNRERRLYPKPPDVAVSDILEWEIVVETTQQC